MTNLNCYGKTFWLCLSIHISGYILPDLNFNNTYKVTTGGP